MVAAVLLVGGLFFLLVLANVSRIVSYLLAVNIITLCFYGYDKLRAVKRAWRVPEFVLHLLAMLGGTPGALVGQLLFRHKTRAGRFRVIFIIIVVAQVTILLVIMRSGLKNFAGFGSLFAGL